MTNNVHQQFDWILKVGYDFIGQKAMVVDFLLKIIKCESLLKKNYTNLKKKKKISC